MKTVLILEGDRETSNMLKKLVEECDRGARIIQAYNMETACRAVMSRRVELMIVELMLPAGHQNTVEGLEFIEAVRRIERYAFVPVIIVSALTDETLYAFHRLHCYGYLEKPFSKPCARELILDALRYRMPEEERKYLYLKSGGQIFPVKLSEVVYIRHIRRLMELHMKDGELQIPHHTCKDIMPAVEESGFVICARGIIVNMAYIKVFDAVNGYITLKDGYGSLEVGRIYGKKIKDTLQLL